MKTLGLTILALLGGAVATGCEGFSPFESAPPGPPKPIGPGPDGGVDAPEDAPPDGAPGEHAGHLCLIGDLRTPLVCASNIDFTGVAISQVGTTNTATAAADGTFSIALEPGTYATLRVAAGSAEFATTLVRLAQAATDPALPLLSAADAEAIIANSDVTPVAGRGQTVFWFSQTQGLGKVPRSDVALATLPTGASAVYETLDALTWTTGNGQTSASGVALALNVPVGSHAFSATYSGQTLPITQVPSEAGAWTFVTALFAP